MSALCIADWQYLTEETHFSGYLLTSRLRLESSFERVSRGFLQSEGVFLSLIAKLSEKAVFESKTKTITYCMSIWAYMLRHIIYISLLQ